MSHTPHQQHPRILIAGCGYTGLRAARAWLSRGLTVTAITRSTTRAHTLQQHGLQTLVADLADNSTLPELPDAQIVVWSAGYDRNSSNSRRQLWIDGLTKLLHKLPDSPHPRRLILTSTTSVYGDAAGSSVDESTTP
ncbi:MAG TPA: hypothetical protein DIT89_03520, partial [Planctomycetaceae bacterium]|nr:hypothetical protein [Planctomycetaceae bacterium]